MDSDRPKLSEVADESDDTTQMEDEMRRYTQVSDQACFLSAEKEDDEVLPLSIEDIYKYDPRDLPLSNGFRCSTIPRSYVRPEPDRPRFDEAADYHNWRDYMRFHCYPLDKYVNEWPNNPTSFKFNQRSSTGKNESDNSNNSAKTCETLPLNIGNPDPTTVGYDYKEWYHHYQTGTNCRDVRPNSVTGSGFWKPTSTNKPTYYSNTTPSRPNYTPIFAFMDNQPQPSKPQSNQHPAWPEVRIDILDGNTDLLIYRSWKEYTDKLKNSLYDDDAMKIMSGTFTVVAGQVIGGVMVQRISSSDGASYSWAGSAVEIATVLGLCVTLAGISLRGRSRAHSALMVKIGAVITASAIVFSMGLHLPPAMALTVGPVMFLIMAAAAAFA